MNEKYADLFSPMEIDAIGEILNISLGSSATAMSDMLDRRVNITTPNVNILAKDEFDFASLEPAVGVEITYVSGMEGSNIMLLKRSDVRKILEILMGMEIPDDQFVLDEISLSAVCEVMNQMMGASATALADFIGEPVNISTPVSFEVEDAMDFKDKYYTEDTPMVVIGFKLEIEDCVASEFLTLMSISLAKKLIGSVTTIHDASLAETPADMPPDVPPQAQAVIEEDPQAAAEAIMASMSGDADAEEDPQAMAEAVMAAMAADAGQQPLQAPPQPQMQQAAPQMQQPMMNQQMQPQMQQPMVDPQMQQAMMGQQMQPQMMAQPMPQMMQQQPKVINVQPQVQTYNIPEYNLSKEQETNLDLIMQVPLQISVEIGRTKKLVKEILEFNQGTLVVLDKLAGDQVDIYVNGQCVAKGDVVVVDDSFGVKITEIIKKEEMEFAK